MTLQPTTARIVRARFDEITEWRSQLASWPAISDELGLPNMGVTIHALQVNHPALTDGVSAPEGVR